MRKILLIIGGLLVLLAISVSPAQGTEDEPISAGTGDYGWLEVDGYTYRTYDAKGASVHWETPDTNPTWARTSLDLEWTGNGSENLPCLGGIHWVSTKNILTISNCLPYTPPTTTTTLVSVTTTTVPLTTTTTSTPDSTTTTTVPTPTCEYPDCLPNTGIPARLFGYAGVAFMILGIATLSALRK